MTQFESLIAAFANETGLPLEVDERESCSLETDGLVVTMLYSHGTDEVVIFAPVTDVESGVPKTRVVYEKALSLAYDGKGTAGAYLGLFGGELLLSFHLPMPGLGARELGMRLTAFADAALSIRAELAAAAALLDADGGAARSFDADPVNLVRV